MANDRWPMTNGQDRCLMNDGRGPIFWDSLVIGHRPFPGRWAEPSDERFAKETDGSGAPEPGREAEGLHRTILNESAIGNKIDQPPDRIDRSPENLDRACVVLSRQR